MRSLQSDLLGKLLCPLITISFKFLISIWSWIYPNYIIYCIEIDLAVNVRSMGKKRLLTTAGGAGDIQGIDGSLVKEEVIMGLHIHLLSLELPAIATNGNVF